MSDLEAPQTQSGGAADAADAPQSPPQTPQPTPPPASAPNVPSAPRPRKSRTGAFALGAVTGCVVLVGGFFLLAIFIAAVGTDRASFSLAAEKVAVVPIEGEIMEARETLELLDRYTENATVKAIVIRINSPGGAIAPSQEIYSAILRARSDSGKPIVASLDSVAASGGFYIASACDRIVANPGTITGSIGVILQWFEMRELVQWAKMNPQTITSGALKDAGSPFRELTPGEREYFQGVVQQLHAQFVRDVVRGRGGKMKAEEVARVADGRIFTGEQALSLKLVDELGSIDDAVRTAGRLAGIEGEPARIWPRPREDRLLDLLIGSGPDALLERVASRRIPQFLYRW